MRRISQRLNIQKKEDTEDLEREMNVDTEQSTDVGTEYSEINEVLLSEAEEVEEAGIFDQLVKRADQSDIDKEISDKAFEIEVEYETAYSDKVIVNIAISDEDDNVINFYPYDKYSSDISELIGLDDEVIVRQLLIDLKEMQLIKNLYRDDETKLLSLPLDEDDRNRLYSKFRSKGRLAEPIPI